MTMDEALDAITLAGGFRYKKTGGLYYVYKPKETIDPQADRIQMRIFKLKYAEMDKIKEILSGIKGMRPIQIHEASKTIIVEDTPENLKKIEMRPIGFVSRTSPNENDRDRSLVAKVVLDEHLAPALDGIED